MTRPRFSVITVCRNAQALIGPSGLSLRGQTCGDYEWLVVDGASTDATLQVVAALAVPSVRVRSEPDQGIYDAMNKAVSLARGDWIYFLNAGDTFADSGVLADVAAAQAHDPGAELVFGDMVYIGPEGEQLRRFKHVSGSTLIFESLNHQATFARRALFERHGTFNLAFRTSADYDWFLRVFRAGTGTRYLPRVIARFLTGGAHRADLPALLRERHALRLQYISPATLTLGLQVGRLRRRWRKARGYVG